VDTGFPKKIMLKQSAKAGRRFEEKSSRFSHRPGALAAKRKPAQLCNAKMRIAFRALSIII
jgi:hypothetical protein